MHAYARACESGSDDEQEKELRDIYSGVSRLLGRLLEKDDTWNRYWWVDSILPVGIDDPLNRNNPDLRLHGIMIWGDKGIVTEWGEPCSILLAEASGELKYEIRVGDAHRGLGKVPYGSLSQKTISMIPAEWQFEFCN